MGLERLNAIYQTVVMDHYQHPRHYGHLDHPTHTMELLNPTCGDMIEVQCRVEAGVIQDLAFVGSGCAISMASASMMTQALMGQPVNRALEVIHAFNALITGQDEGGMAPDQLKAAIKEAAILENIQQLPARYKCAILAWRALEKGLTGQESGEAI